MALNQNNRDRRTTSATFHNNPKQRMLGGGSGGNWRAGNVAPAWRAGPTSGASGGIGRGMRGGGVEGSKILLSHLPVDVSENEVVELFKKTIGPLVPSGTFLIYNSQGRPKGMAIVAFQRTADAGLAKEKYDGKLIDGRRPIKIEIISEYDPQFTRSHLSHPSQPSQHPSHPPQPRQSTSLLDRISKPTSTTSSSTAPLWNNVHNAHNVHQLPRQAAAAELIASQAASSQGTTSFAKKRMKKGPKRLNKRGMGGVEIPRFAHAYNTQNAVNGMNRVGGSGGSVNQSHLSKHVKRTHKTKEQLDEEMDVYRAEEEDEED
ncbi:hypothetical protein C8R42DRAFT_639204 [Lentinula raphanica]|nr:hypothetical protein C8R42DRAFT_639204 [Lentinula raphanica]